MMIGFLKMYSEISLDFINNVSCLYDPEKIKMNPEKFEFSLVYKMKPKKFEFEFEPREN